MVWTRAADRIIKPISVSESSEAGVSAIVQLSEKVLNWCWKKVLKEGVEVDADWHSSRCKPWSFHFRPVCIVCTVCTSALGNSRGFLTTNSTNFYNIYNIYYQSNYLSTLPDVRLNWLQSTEAQIELSLSTICQDSCQLFDWLRTLLPGEISRCQILFTKPIIIILQPWQIIQIRSTRMIWSADLAGMTIWLDLNWSALEVCRYIWFVATTARECTVDIIDCANGSLICTGRVSAD